MLTLVYSFNKHLLSTCHWASFVLQAGHNALGNQTWVLSWWRLQSGWKALGCTQIEKARLSAMPGP